MVAYGVIGRRKLPAIGPGIEDRLFCCGKVGLAYKQDGVALGPVAAGPARLLVLGFHGLGHVVVHHEAAVGFVDTHPEGIGGGHQGQAPVDPPCLDVLALL